MGNVDFAEILDPDRRQVLQRLGIGDDRVVPFDLGPEDHRLRDIEKLIELRPENIAAAMVEHDRLNVVRVDIDVAATAIRISRLLEIGIPRIGLGLENLVEDRALEGRGFTVTVALQKNIEAHRPPPLDVRHTVLAE